MARRQAVIRDWKWPERARLVVSIEYDDIEARNLVKATRWFHWWPAEREWQARHFPFNEQRRAEFFDILRLLAENGFVFALQMDEPWCMLQWQPLEEVIPAIEQQEGWRNGQQEG